MAIEHDYEPRYVQAGDRIHIPVRSGSETLIWDTVVAGPCENDRAGYWYCGTCKESIENNMGVGYHAQRHHLLAWICYEHGPETVKAT